MRRIVVLTLIAVFGVVLARTHAVTDGILDGTRHPGLFCC